MKNIVKVLSIILLLTFIVGCSKVTDTDLLDTVDDTESKEKPVETTTPETEVKETTQTTETTEVTDTQKEEQKQETTETATTENEEEEEKTTTQTQNPELKVLLDKIGTKVRNLEYTFGEPPFNTEVNDYKVQIKDAQGNEEMFIKINLYAYDELPLMDDRWDTVFLNPEEKTATLYCLDRTYCQSKDRDKINESKEVNYDDYKTMTPYDWAMMIPNDAKLVGKELMDGRSVSRFSFIGPEGFNYEIWIDNTYGMPMQVEKDDPAGTKIKYAYRDLSFNSVKTDDFKKPF